MLGPLAGDLAKCVHCGLCLQHCPTYLQTGQETESPRGRIHLIEALNEGRIEVSDQYANHLNLCLVCRACESACPSGVPFGRIMEQARAQLVSRRPGAWGERLLRWVAFQQLMPHRSRLRTLAVLLRAYQRSGLQALVRGTKLLPGSLRRTEYQLPLLSERFFEPPVERFPAFGSRRYRVGLFSGCVMPYLYAEVHAATLRVLRQNGCEVVVPRSQGCCGALNVHSGERVAARAMARRNLTAFLDAGLDAVIVNAAGCGSTLKEYGDLLGEDPGDRSLVARFTPLVRDVSEFLASIMLAPPSRLVRRRVTLQESCHLVHAQRIKAAPRQILAAIPGLELVDLRQPDLCCGSAGVYNLLQPMMSTAILTDKVAELRATGADTVVTANPGCLLQLAQGARAAGLGIRVVHLVQLLDEAYGGPTAK
jgi:glycolate oxidase iron-sulfur subunit